MSYILDALRKSDLQRQQAKAPTLLTAHALPDSPQRKNLGLNAVVAALLIAAGVLIGWLQPWRSTPPALKPVDVARTIPVQPALPQTPDIHAQAETRLPDAPKAAAAQPNEIRPKPAQTPAAEPTTRAEPLPPPRQEEKAPADAVAVQSGGASPPPRQQDAPILKQSELPAEIRQALPTIVIAFHQYSPVPAEQRVMINNIVLRPGEMLSPGLRLEHITADGVVLSFQNYRFRHGLR